MVLERITVWEAFQLLTAAAQNAEFDNLLDEVNSLLTRMDQAEKKFVVLKVIPDSTALTTGDGKYTFVVPAELAGKNIVSVGAHVFTVSSSGTPTIQIARDRAGVVVDVLSTPITIDENEKDSSTAAVQPVINVLNDSVTIADVLRIDVDVAGTSTAGLEVRIGFQVP